MTAGSLHGLLEGFNVVLNDFGLSSLRATKARAEQIPFGVEAFFAECRNIREFRITFGVENSQNAKFGFVALNELGNVSNLGAGEVNFALTKSQRLVGCTAVRNGFVLEAGALSKR